MNYGDLNNYSKGFVGLSSLLLFGLFSLMTLNLYRLYKIYTQASQAYPVKTMLNTQKTYEDVEHITKQNQVESALQETNQPIDLDYTKEAYEEIQKSTPVSSATSVNTTPPIMQNALVECIGPDGIHFYTSNSECVSFNAAWGNYPTPSPAPQPKFISSGTYHTDSLGITHFRNEDGTTGTGYTDSLGFTRYSDNTGLSGHFYTDSLGFTHWSDNQGNQINAHTDSLGITRYSGNGVNGYSYTDSLGFTNYSGTNGRISCYTNSLGFTTCH